MQGELAHCTVKRFYSLTNKKNATKQIAKKYCRKQLLQQAEQREIQEATSQSHLEDHHFISASRNQPFNIYSFVHTNPGDPAKKVRIFLHIFNHVFVYFVTDSNSRTLFAHYTLIFWVACLGSYMMVMNSTHLQKRIDSQ